MYLVRYLNYAIVLHLQ